MNVIINNIKIVQKYRLSSKLVGRFFMIVLINLFILISFYISLENNYNYKIIENNQSYSETIEESWPIDYSRNLSFYIKPSENTAIIKPIKKCHKTDTFLNIIVTSSISNTKKRLAIRRTWGSQNKINNQNVVVNFLLGQTDDDNLTKIIKKESNKYGDIIQESFHDSYWNLTIKVGMMLKWVTKNCQNTKYIMKVDDDVYVNVTNLLKSISHNEKNENNFLLGQTHYAKLTRNPKSKWYMPEYLYNKTSYPIYMLGSGYVMSQLAVKKIYNESLFINFIHIEDIFYTGICGEKANVTLIDDQNFQRHYIYSEMITKFNAKVDDMFRIWLIYN